jgi:hypothetical protein
MSGSVLVLSLIIDPMVMEPPSADIWDRRIPTINDQTQGDRHRHDKT